MTYCLSNPTVCTGKPKKSLQQSYSCMEINISLNDMNNDINLRKLREVVMQTAHSLPTKSWCCTRVTLSTSSPHLCYDCLTFAVGGDNKTLLSPSLFLVSGGPEEDEVLREWLSTRPPRLAPTPPSFSPSHISSRMYWRSSSSSIREVARALLISASAFGDKGWGGTMWQQLMLLLLLCCRWSVWSVLAIWLWCLCCHHSPWLKKYQYFLVI